MKLIDLMSARKIFVDHSKDKMPVPIAYKFMKFLKLSENDSNFYQEKITSIADEYSVKDEQGQYKGKDGCIQIQPAKYDECNEAISALQNMEINAPSIEFEIADFNNIELSISDLLLLDGFIKNK